MDKDKTKINLLKPQQRVGDRFETHVLWGIVGVVLMSPFSYVRAKTFALVFIVDWRVVKSFGRSTEDKTGFVAKFSLVLQA